MTDLWSRLVQRIAAERLVKIKEWEHRMIVFTPGLELDKLIAKNVLFWDWDSDIEGPREWWFEKRKPEALHLNHYSTDIKAAWDLVEKFKLCVVPWGGQWTATRQGQIFIDGERNMAPTAPHAICLAALFYANEDADEDGE